MAREYDELTFKRHDVLVVLPWQDGFEEVSELNFFRLCKYLKQNHVLFLSPIPSNSVDRHPPAGDVIPSISWRRVSLGSG
ncbi:unnamed protein product [Protopolystoma xenopodis]|uniref:Uncharacterized protein n=1 Tax=Protopolystoma xenopodis TaxID=117903 RepID=A0A3S5FF46_9PLAT|nr:unnamed protein product [Protopolystoma xenopodis]